MTKIIYSPSLIYKVVLLSVLFCLVWVSCTSEHILPEADPSTMGRVKWQITDTLQTRATTTVLSKEEADNFYLTLYKGNKLVRTRTRIKDFNPLLTIGSGYYAIVENCSLTEAESNDESWGQRRYEGISKPFSVRTQETTTVPIQCHMANAGVCVVFDQSVINYFTINYQVDIQQADRTVVFNSLHAGTQHEGVISPGKIAYFNTDAQGASPITYTIKGETPQKSYYKRGEISLQKGQISQLRLVYSPGTFELDITHQDVSSLVDNESWTITDADLIQDDGHTDMNTTHESFTEDEMEVTFDQYGEN